MYDGIDTAARITAAQAAKLRQNGVEFVARYLAPGKALTAAEVADLRDAGLAIMLCWETSANRVKGGATAGAADAMAARQAAEALGVPAGTVIFFACDYDAPSSDFASIEAYLRTATYNIEQYGVGLYGPERVIAAMSERGACFYFWQCVAWSNQFLPVADVRQYAWQGDARAKAMAAACGISAVDLDSAETLAGMWAAPVKPKPEPKPWYAEAMAWAKEQGYIRDGRPNDPVTRAELATVLFRIHGPEDDKKDSGLLSKEG